MSIASVVLETADPNSIGTLPITLEEAVVAVQGHVGKALAARDDASILLTKNKEQADLAEASRLAALVSQTAAAASAASASATLATAVSTIDAAEAASIVNVNAARDQAIVNVLSAGSIPAFATNAEALAGTANNLIMTPLRVQEKIDQSGLTAASLMKLGAF